MNAHRIALIAALVVAVQAHAVVIYDTFGPDPYVRSGPTYLATWGYSSNGQGVGQAYGSPFSFAGSAYELQSITLDISLNGSEPNANLQIGIYADDGGRPSLTPITLLAPSPTLIIGQKQLLTYSFTQSAILQPATSYWLTLAPNIVGVSNHNYDSQYSISSSSSVSPLPVAARTYFHSTDSWGEWTTYPGTPPPVFRLEGAAVPEPSTWALLGLGSALFWCAARRRRK